jgi:hypothetical protein
MKITTKIVSALCIALMALPFFGNAQPNKKAAPQEGAVEWTSVKFSNGVNEQKGVLFYTRVGLCGAEKVSFTKLVNQNTYSVKVAYQLDPQSAPQYVRIPAGATIEGVCKTANENLAKLTVPYPVGKTDDELKKIGEFRIAHIFVSEIK